jgi:hypothetical protein
MAACCVTGLGLVMAGHLGSEEIWGILLVKEDGKNKMMILFYCLFSSPVFREVC